jgi:hypothetical protein
MEKLFARYFENLWKGSILTDDESDEFIFYFFDWKHISFEDLRLALNEELKDKLLENTDLIPLALLCEPETINLKDLISNDDEYERMEILLDTSYNYLMYDQRTAEIYHHSWGKVADSIESLHLECIEKERL